MKTPAMTGMHGEGGRCVVSSDLNGGRGRMVISRGGGGWKYLAFMASFGVYKCFSLSVTFPPDSPLREAGILYVDFKAPSRLLASKWWRRFFLGNAESR